ncbi:MAG: hypothetical protein GY826_33320 [Fuerstiella sp.]|jgi:hypothetical protein|nr:hypothetical protein [Fuerstiella sp.]MDG2129719.1 hypothetical protein [Fuerstiella sp.]
MPHSCEVRWRATALHCVNSKWEKQTGLRGPADSQLRLIKFSDLQRLQATVDTSVVVREDA